MALKGASPDHEGEERADRWALDPLIAELASPLAASSRDRDLRRAEPAG